MKQDYIIFLPFAILALTVMILSIIAFVKFRKLYANKDNQNGHVEPDDIPGRYLDIQYSEQPFIDCY